VVPSEEIRGSKNKGPSQRDLLRRRRALRRWVTEIRPRGRSWMISQRIVNTSLKTMTSNNSGKRRRVRRVRPIGRSGRGQAKQQCRRSRPHPLLTEARCSYRAPRPFSTLTTSSSRRLTASRGVPGFHNSHRLRASSPRRVVLLFLFFFCTVTGATCQGGCYRLLQSIGTERASSFRARRGSRVNCHESR
jgi:hypothetical protein